MPRTEQHPPTNREKTPKTPKTPGNPGIEGLKAVYLRANDAWVWMFRGTVLHLKHEGTLFPTRQDAYDAWSRVAQYPRSAA